MLYYATVRDLYYVAPFRFYFEVVTGSLKEGISASLNNEFGRIKPVFSTRMSFCSFFGGEVFKDHFKAGIVFAATYFFISLFQISTWRNFNNYNRKHDYAVMFCRDCLFELKPDKKQLLAPTKCLGTIF